MASELFVDKITRKTGTSGGAPITLSGDTLTATLGTSSTVPASVGASLVLLNTTTISTAVASVSFNSSLITTTYNAYRVIFTGVGIVGTGDNFDFLCEFSNNNGTSTISYESVYDYISINTSHSGQHAGQTHHVLWFDAESENTDASGAGIVDFILSPETGTGIDCHSFSETSVESSNGAFYGYRTLGISISQSSTARVNHINFRDAANVNIDTGKFSLYGFKF